MITYMVPLLKSYSRLSQFNLVVHDFPVFLAVELEGSRFLKIALHILNFGCTFSGSLCLTRFRSGWSCSSSVVRQMEKGGREEVGLVTGV